MLDSGLSWADQWDYDTPDPPPQPTSQNEKSKGKDGHKKTNNIGKKLLSFKWMKDLRKKPQK